MGDHTIGGGGGAIDTATRHHFCMCLLPDIHGMRSYVWYLCVCIQELAYRRTFVYAPEKHLVKETQVAATSQQKRLADGWPPLQVAACLQHESCQGFS